MLSTATAFLVAYLAFLQPPKEAEIVAAADRLAAEYLSKKGAVGLSVAVALDGDVIVGKGYGLAEVEHSVKADADTLFRVGSITKQFTAVAVMRLVEQGRLSLDDPVTKHLPGYNAQGREITIRHLLTHTSGIKNYTELKQIMVDAPEREIERQTLLDMVQKEPLAFDPGTKTAYTNTGYYLLGMIIEKVSGKAYCAYLRDELFVPLSLTRTRCDSNIEVIEDRAQGYAVVDEELVNDRVLATGTSFAAGVLLASARDLVVWADALSAGKVVSPASYKLMSTPVQLAGGSVGEYGFGFIIDSLDGRRRLQHGGSIFGFNAMLARFPDDKVTVAVISNSQTVSAARLAESLSRAALGLSEPTAAAAVNLPDAVAARCVGVYTFPGAGWDVTISSREGKLFSRASEDAESAMVYLGNGEFGTTLYEKGVRLVFDLAGEKPAPTFVLHEGGAALTAQRK